MKLEELAQKLGCRLEGSSGVEITGVAGIEHAVEGQLTFVANRRYATKLKTTNASAVLIEEGTPIPRPLTRRGYIERRLSRLPRR